MFALPRDYTFLNYLRCHDDIGWGLDYDFLARFGMEEVAHKKFLNDYFTGKFPASVSRGELYNNDPRLGDARLCGTTASLCGVEKARREEDVRALSLALRRDLMLHAFMFTLSGIPVLYSGDEIAQENDYAYHGDPLKCDDSRWLHRGAMRWAATSYCHVPDTPEGRMFTGIGALEALHASHRAFHGAADTWIVETGSDRVLGIGRYYRGEKLIGLFHFGRQPETVWTDQGELFTDLLTGRRCSAQGLCLQPGEFRWLVYDFEAGVTREK